MKYTFLSPVFWLLIFFITQAFAQSNDSKASETLYDKMAEYQNDLRGYVNSSSANNDFSAAQELMNICRIYTHLAQHLSDLTMIMSNIESQEYRNQTLSLINRRKKYFKTLIEIDIERINIEISSAKNYAIISTGQQMKAELRNFLSEITR